MDIASIQLKIEKLINDLSTARMSIRKFAELKANNVANYEKSISKTIIMLQNGQITSFDDLKISSVTATNVEKIARGICWKEKLESDLAEATYKAAIIAIECLKSELNGYQSIYKYSEYSVKN